MLTITSNSIDELNQLYRQLKHSYVAQSKIQLNPDSLKYQLVLEKKSLNPVIKNLSEKSFEWCEAQWSQPLENLDELISVLENNKTIPFVNQLLIHLSQQSTTQKLQVLHYFKELAQESANLTH